MDEPKYGTTEWYIYVEDERKRLEGLYDKVWNTDELQEDFIVDSFLAPFVFVTKRDKCTETGSLTFQHSPRFYYNYKAR